MVSHIQKNVKPLLFGFFLVLAYLLTPTVSAGVEEFYNSFDNLNLGNLMGQPTPTGVWGDGSDEHIVIQGSECLSGKCISAVNIDSPSTDDSIATTSVIVSENNSVTLSMWSKVSSTTAGGAMLWLAAQPGSQNCKISLDDGEWQSHNDSFNNEMFEKEYGWKKGQTRKYLEWYARFELGKKIYKHLKNNDSCSFQAEL